MLDSIIQMIILITSAASIWFIGRKEHWSKWGYVIGIVSQPFWLYTTYQNSQWGLFALSIFYLYSWGMGVYNNFDLVLVISEKANIRTYGSRTAGPK